MEEKSKRDREQNWDRTEKEIFRQFVYQHIKIIEDKGNDFKKIAGKKAAWEEIKSDMAASGYQRTIEKMRAQWSRMKVSAKKAKTATKKALNATGNMVHVPKTDRGDELVQAMIADQLEDDTIFIDSDTVFPVVDVSSNREDPPATDHPQSVGKQSGLNAIFPDETPMDTIEQINDNGEEEITFSNIETPVAPSTSRDLLGKLRKLPKKPMTKCEVMEARKEQIEKESSHETERHFLQIAQDKELLKQMQGTTQHLKKKQNLEIIRMEELHQLQVEKLKLEIEQLKKAALKE